MSRYDNRYAARFLAVSRIALGLAPETSELAARLPRDPATCRTLLDSDTACPLDALRVTDEQRDDVIDVLQGHVPAIREQMKAVRRAVEARRIRMARDVAASPVGTFVDEMYARYEIARLRAGAMRELRRVLTPYQRVRLDLGRPA
jgi:Spy/CpxP family protein refolding chaperone